MKKNILFVIPNMRVGGAEKSLLNLLSLFDYEKYNVDLFLFRKDGLFLSQIPKEVNLIGDTTYYEAFDGNAKNAIKYFLKKLKIKSALQRYFYAKQTDENSKWLYLKKQLPKLEKKYDCAIAYLEGNASRFVVESINADKKISYVHTDISKSGIDKKINENIFKSCNFIVTVSDECKLSLQKNYPDFSEKFILIENILNHKILEKMSKEFTAFDDKNTQKIVTVARCSQPKNLQLAVKTCNELKRRKLNVKWYLLGNGELENEIRELVKKLQLEDTFIMLGDKPNPYPYIAQSDVYVQTSLFEGKSIAIEEAKSLKKPIVVTNFSTVDDQIEDGVTGLVCQMNESDVADKIQQIFENDLLAKALTNNLKKYSLGNEKEIEKLYTLIEC